jgi:hypothetical protein
VTANGPQAPHLPGPRLPRIRQPRADHLLRARGPDSQQTPLRIGVRAAHPRRPDVADRFPSNTRGTGGGGHRCNGPAWGRSAPSDRPLERRARRAPADGAGRRAADGARRGADRGSRADGRHGLDASPRNAARFALHDPARTAAAAAPLAQHRLRAELRAPAAGRSALDGKSPRALSAVWSRTATCWTSCSDDSSRTSRRDAAEPCGSC